MSEKVHHVQGVMPTFQSHLLASSSVNNIPRLRKLLVALKINVHITNISLLSKGYNLSCYRRQMYLLISVDQGTKNQVGRA